MTVGWYAGLVRYERKALLLGPYETRELADANVARAHDAACDIDAFCWFDTPAVFRLEMDELPDGKLNKTAGMHLVERVLG
jgi:hypothetical protein